RDVDAGLAEQGSHAPDHAGHVVVEADHEERRELQLDLEAEDVDEPRPVVAADRRAGGPEARAGVPHLDPYEVRIVAGRGGARLSRPAAARRGARRGAVGLRGAGWAALGRAV